MLPTVNKDDTIEKKGCEEKQEVAHVVKFGVTAKTFFDALVIKLVFATLKDAAAIQDKDDGNGRKGENEQQLHPAVVSQEVRYGHSFHIAANFLRVESHTGVV